MRCEVIAIGTELLLGQHVDTNSAWIGEQLALAGIDSYFQTRVGDNPERIATALHIALERNDAIIVCGGLGPTQDDLTRDVIARVMDAPLVRDEVIVTRIQERFKARNRPMPDNNRRQADVPQGASLIPQMPGTAPGLVCPVGDKVIYAVPGVPSEMKAMVLGTVISDLQRRAGLKTTIRSRTLRTWGQSESGLAEMLAERIQDLDSLGNPTLAFLASGIEGIKVRITAKAADETAAQRILATEEARLQEILGHLVFGRDEETMETVVLKQLAERGLSLAVAESISGGLVAARLSTIANTVLQGAVLCPSAASQRQLLGVSEEALPDPAATAQAMALGVARLMNAAVGLAVTAADEQNPATNSVFLGLAINGHTEVQCVQLPGNREQVRQFSVISLLNFLRLRLLGTDLP
ncbi:MAG: CinA family nicotinamide mononucleotide deamidase-related protein [Candidatus Competibacteraceae bacterium]|jgi:nicotinamide-nucleotide amidase|nr:CinA family nicotinamide mononucleotide deamidase-related protein [Candidatus Competibacteraceae bacterium]